MEQSKLQIGNLAKALAAAQLEIKAPIKNRHVDFVPKNGGPRVKYSYADLADVIESCKPLAKHGLAVIHQMTLDEAMGLLLITSLIHESGESVKTLYPLPDPSKIRAQDFGSALTYARRYSLSSIVGIASEEDDDGQEAPPPEPPKKPSYPQNNPQKITMTTPPSKITANAGTGGPNPKPSDPEYFDDLDHALDEPKTKLQLLHEMVEDLAIPHDVVKVYIKQAVGPGKNSTNLTESEIDAVMQRIKLSVK